MLCMWLCFGDSSWTVGHEDSRRPCVLFRSLGFFFFKQKTAYEMRISDWSSDVCSSDLPSFLASARRTSGAGRSWSSAIEPHGAGPPPPLLRGFEGRGDRKSVV